MARAYHRTLYTGSMTYSSLRHQGREVRLPPEFEKYEGRENVVTTTTPAASDELTRGQEVALLTMRKSDLSIAALDELKKLPGFGVRGADFYACAEKGLAVHKGKYHVLNSSGRWRADEIARRVVREAGLHVITYFDGDKYLPPSAYCSCGSWSARRTVRYNRALPNVRFEAEMHLRAVQQKTAAAGIPE